MEFGSRIKIELWSLDPSKLLKSVQSNADGRVDAPLLAGDEMSAIILANAGSSTGFPCGES